MSVSTISNSFELGPCLVDSDSCTIVRDGEKAKVTPRSMDVLLYLAEHVDRIVSSDELLDTFWSPLASDHAIHKAIAELRSALGDSVRAQRFIKTVPKRGYKLLLVPSTTVDESEPQARSTSAVTRLTAAIERLRYVDYKMVTVGLLVGLSLWVVSVAAPSLEQRPGERHSLILAQYPFQLQSQDSNSTELFALGLYANLVTRLSEIDLLRVIAVEPQAQESAGSQISSRPAPDLSDFQVRGTIVQTGKSTSLYINLVRSSDGIVEISRRLEISPSAVPEDLDPLTDQLVNLIVTHLPLDDQNDSVTARVRP
ncbi:MAG: winged helix-turn-helix domain-containing protein [Gammaproteobacteria bacterium]|nr:winged helix-turn-helix domain-containing protein [Gammaproteobacteria bacterium]